VLPTARVREIAAAVAAKATEMLGPEASTRWFGSWVRGTARLHSDIDLAISSPSGVDPTDYGRLIAWVTEDLPTLYTIDLINLGEVSEDFRIRILQEGIEVQGNDESRLSR
jgi:predicted nucleotidyltransferase